MNFYNLQKSEICHGQFNYAIRFFPDANKSCIKSTSRLLFEKLLAIYMDGCEIKSILTFHIFFIKMASTWTSYGILRLRNSNSNPVLSSILSQFLPSFFQFYY